MKQGKPSTQEAESPRGVLTDHDLERLKRAQRKISDDGIPRLFRILQFGAPGRFCEEARIATNVAASGSIHPDDVDEFLNESFIEWGKWVRIRTFLGDSEAFRRMAVFVDALNEQTAGGELKPRLPKDVSLKELGIKQPKGRPSSMSQKQSALSLFAMAAGVPVTGGLLSRTKPQAIEIWQRIRELQRDAEEPCPRMDQTQFSQAVKHYGLTGLIDYGKRKHGPKKGSRQSHRLKTHRASD